MYRILVATIGCLLGAEAFFAPATFTQTGLPWMQGGRVGTSSCQPLSMASTADFKNGVTIEIDGNPCKILEFLHVKPGKGSAFVRTKIKNLITGNSLEKTFRAGEPITLAQVDRLELQYTYADGDVYNFMDTKTFEEVSIPSPIIGDMVEFMFEGMNMEAMQYNGKIIEVIIPKTLSLTVTQTDPGEKGNTAQGATKPATLETGATINVPLFIKEGEKIVVNTEEKKYVSRG